MKYFANQKLPSDSRLVSVVLNTGEAVKARCEIVLKNKIRRINWHDENGCFIHEQVLEWSEII